MSTIDRVTPPWSYGVVKHVAIVAFALALAVACSKREAPEPSGSATAATSAAPMSDVGFATVGDATVMVPPGFAVEQDREDVDIVVHLAAGGTVRLTTSGACAASLAVICRRAHGELRGDTCAIARNHHLRVADDIIHEIRFEGDVPARVLSSWSVPSRAPRNLGFYCPAELVVMNISESLRPD